MWVEEAECLIFDAIGKNELYLLTKCHDEM